MVPPTVTEHTLDLLYSAQHRQQQQPQHQQHDPMLLLQEQQIQAQAPAHAAAALPAVSNQPSLHSFWNLGGGRPSPASASTLASVPTPLPPCSSSAAHHPAPIHCEDCGAGLTGGGGDDDGDMMMDVDPGSGGGSDAEGRICGACGKAVCFSCSVSNLGEQRRCLACAGRRVWVGGIGWTVAPVAVC